MSTNSQKTRLIPAWAGSLITSLLTLFTGRILASVKLPSLRNFVDKVLGRAKELVTAISDANPDNEEQLEAILKKFVAEDAVPLADEFLVEKIAGIDNERVRRGLTILSLPAINTIKLLTDDDPDNAAQAEAEFDALLLTSGAQEYIIADVVTPILEKRVPDPILRSFLLDALATGIREGAEALAAQDTFDKDGGDDFNTGRVLEVIHAAKKKADREASTLVAMAA